MCRSYGTHHPCSYNAFNISRTVVILAVVALIACGPAAEAVGVHTEDEYGHYINEYVMEIDGDRQVAELVAGVHNLKLVDHVSN